MRKPVLTPPQPKSKPNPSPPHHHHTDSRGKKRKPTGKHLRCQSDARWCGGLAASSSHHHLYHVYMVKTRFGFEGGDVDLKKA
jgi:hypothetical protein